MQAGRTSSEAERPRSRSGCGTCRARKKKCDENFDAAGRCQRCAKGAFSCQQELHHPPPRRRRKPTVAIAPTSPAVAQGAPRELTTPEAMQSILAGLIGVPTLDDATVDAVTPVLSEGPGSSTSTDAAGSHLPTAGIPGLDALGVADLAGSTDLALAHLLGLGEAASFPGSGMPSLESMLNWLEPPSTLEAELRKFTDDWWGFYVSISDSYLFSILKPQRNLMYARLRYLIGGNKLGRASIGAMCASHYAHNLDHDDVRRAEWQEKANKYYEEGLKLLAQGLDFFPLRVLLMAVVDLRISKIDSDGSLPAKELLGIGEFFVKQSGIERSINMGALPGADNFALRNFIYVDVFHSVVTYGRPTLFNITNFPVEDLPSPNEVGSEELNVLLSLSADLLVCFASIANLSCSSKSMTDAEVEEEAAAIQLSIESAAVKLPASRDKGSADILSDVARQEMWRQAALIFLYTTILHHGPASKAMRQALSEMLHLSHALASPKSPDPTFFMDASLSCPWFLGATIAVEQEDRDECLDGLLRCGSGKVYQENLSVIQYLWELMDERGAVLDWRKIVADNNLHVFFM